MNLILTRARRISSACKYSNIYQNNQLKIKKNDKIHWLRAHDSSPIINVTLRLQLPDVARTCFTRTILQVNSQFLILYYDLNAEFL